MDTNLVLLDAQKSLPALSSIIDKFAQTFELAHTIEEGIGRLAKDESYAKDPVFLVDAHQTLMKSAIGMLDTARKYVDAMARFSGATYPQAPNGQDNKAATPITPDQVASSLGNSKFKDVSNEIEV